MIRVFPNTAELSQAAVDIFVQAAQEAVKNQGKFSVALTGGSSPEQLYRLLAQSPYREQVPWEQTFVFWGDERWVPLSDERSNAKLAFDALLNSVPIPKNQIFPMYGDSAPEAYADHYENLIRNHFGNSDLLFDLMLLGMGDDGHTASLFPGTAVLQEQSRWVQAYYLEPQQMYRITLTAPCINRSKKIMFLTFGEKKAEALYQVQEGERNFKKYPSQLINPVNGNTIWLVDESAAAKLSENLKNE
ncbi:6-phosphogluconolactonase [Adhaeribacter pallidiroseus]|uniref:6-phosphogluconolactonase n=1 Tax=Adhaeribacter pallidiroseus TaxID=2072847 RepID=A0A369QEI7_9BACT|nr:6-phosphogluconolactonase [Adhaeribacter pallidiroseus]RDC62842.1 6-phosphogluconolactonase [Adhaeribacter pallidiroseus]